MIEMVEQWTERKGYPTIIVDLQGERTMLVSQQPEFPNGQFWSVPIKFEFYAGREKHPRYSIEFILSDKKFSIVLPERCELKIGYVWFTFNPKFQGYYRVAYQSKLLTTALNEAAFLIPPVNRWQLLIDSYTHGSQVDSFLNFRELIDSISKYSDAGSSELLDKIEKKLRDSERVNNPNSYGKARGPHKSTQ